MQPFDIRYYDQTIQTLFGRALEVLFNSVNLPYELYQRIYPIVTTRGYDLTENILINELTPIGWDEQAAKNIICAVIEYVIYNEGLKVNYPIHHFADSYHWVQNRFAYYKRQAQPQYQQPIQQPYQYQQQPRSPLPITGLQPSYTSTTANPNPVLKQPQEASLFDDIGEKNNMNINDHLPNKNVPNPNTEAFRLSPSIVQKPQESQVKETSTKPEIKEESKKEKLTFEFIEQSDKINLSTVCELLFLKNIASLIETKQQTTNISLGIIPDNELSEINEIIKTLPLCQSIEGYDSLLQNDYLDNFREWLSDYIYNLVNDYLFVNYNIEVIPLPFLTKYNESINYVKNKFPIVNTNALTQAIITKLSSLFECDYVLERDINEEGDKGYIIGFTTFSYELLLPYFIQYNAITKQLTIKGNIKYDLTDLIENCFKTVAKYDVTEIILHTKSNTQYKIRKYDLIQSPATYIATPILP